jgi:hypothetical protein
MDPDQISAMLRGMGERMIELSKIITGADGERLTEDDDKLIRYAAMPAINETVDLMLTAYLVDNRMWKKDNLNRLQQLLNL